MRTHYIKPIARERAARMGRKYARAQCGLIVSLAKNVGPCDCISCIAAFGRVPDDATEEKA